MIYSSASFLNENFDWKKLKNCKVWVASYSDTRPKLPVSADLWQYTKKGSLEGANTDKGYCDLVYSYMEATSIKFTKPTLTMKKIRPRRQRSKWDRMAARIANLLRLPTQRLLRSIKRPVS